MQNALIQYRYLSYSISDSHLDDPPTSYSVDKNRHCSNGFYIRTLPRYSMTVELSPWLIIPAASWTGVFLRRSVKKLSSSWVRLSLFDESPVLCIDVYQSTTSSR